jgi:hypothetical protein
MSAPADTRSIQADTDSASTSVRRGSAVAARLLSAVMDSTTRPQGTRPGRLIALAPYRERLVRFERQAATNTAWDSLGRLADDAWCWRDPEALAALEACVARLQACVREEWGT